MPIYQIIASEGTEWVRLDSLAPPPFPSDFIDSFAGRPFPSDFPRVRATLLHGPGFDRRADFPWFTSGWIVLRGSALERVGDYLRQFGVCLELVSDAESMWLYNVTTETNALDLALSNIKRYRSSGRIMRIERYWFRSNDLPNDAVFRLGTGIDRSVFCTHHFKSMCEEQALIGLTFREVWPGHERSLHDVRPEG